MTDAENIERKVDNALNKIMDDMVEKHVKELYDLFFRQTNQMAMLFSTKFALEQAAHVAPMAFCEFMFNVIHNMDDGDEPDKSRRALALEAIFTFLEEQFPQMLERAAEQDKLDQEEDEDEDA